MVYPPPEKILWCFGEYQTLFSSLSKSDPDIEFIEGFPPDIDQKIDGRSRILLVIDDMMSELSDNIRLSNLFSKGSHHRNISIIFIQQNIFYCGKQSRNLRLNSHYLVLFKSPCDRQQISTLSRQMYPGGEGKFFIEAYNDATKEAFTYLFLDLKPETDDRLRVRANIFPGETNFVYVKKI